MEEQKIVKLGIFERFIMRLGWRIAGFGSDLARSVTYKYNKDKRYNSYSITGDMKELVLSKATEEES